MLQQADGGGDDITHIGGVEVLTTGGGNGLSGARQPQKPIGQVLTTGRERTSTVQMGHPQYQTRQLGDAMSECGRPLPASDARPQPDHREGGSSKRWP